MQKKKEEAVLILNKVTSSIFTNGICRVKKKNNIYMTKLQFHSNSHQ